MTNIFGNPKFRRIHFVAIRLTAVKATNIHLKLNRIGHDHANCF